MSELVGLFGGTFNPIHVGHLRAAEEAAEALGLDRVLFIPAADPPLKRDGSQVIAPAKERLDWVREAIADNPRFEVSALELEREGPSYTVDTLRILREQLAPAELVFIVGQDAFAELPSWREPETLSTLAHFAVVTRPPGVTQPLGSGRLADWLPDAFRANYELSEDGRSAKHRKAGTWIRLLTISALDVSATDLRRRLRKGLSVRYLTPEATREAIEGCEAYRHPPQSPK